MSFVDDTLRLVLADTIEAHTERCSCCPTIEVDEALSLANTLLPLTREHTERAVEQARADEWAEAAARVWLAYGNCCDETKRHQCPYDQHAIGIMRVALGAQSYYEEDASQEIEEQIAHVIRAALDGEATP